MCYGFRHPDGRVQDFDGENLTIWHCVFACGELLIGQSPVNPGTRVGHGVGFRQQCKARPFHVAQSPHERQCFYKCDNPATPKCSASFSPLKHYVQLIYHNLKWPSKPSRVSLSRSDSLTLTHTSIQLPFTHPSALQVQNQDARHSQDCRSSGYSLE